MVQNNTFGRLALSAFTAATIGLAAVQANAAAIGISGFSGGETVEDFSSLGGVAPPTGPFSLGPLTFTETSGGANRVGGWRILEFGTPNMLTDNDDDSVITIDFASSFQRVGLDVGIGPSIYDVAFFDAALSEVGSVEVDLSGGDSFSVAFAGFEHIPGISRVVVTETNSLGNKVGGIDNIRFETEVNAVPLPAALPMAAAGIAVFGLMGWRRQRVS